MLNAEELISSIIVKIDKLADATGVSRCLLIVEIIQMLTTLKEGIANEHKTQEEQRKEYLKALTELTGTDYTDMPIEQALKEVIHVPSHNE